MQEGSLSACAGQLDVIVVVQARDGDGLGRTMEVGKIIGGRISRFSLS